MEKLSTEQLIFAFSLSLILAAWAYFYAKKRGEDPLLWSGVVLFASWIGVIVMLIYFSFRNRTDQDESKNERKKTKTPERLAPSLEEFCDQASWFYVDSIKQSRSEAQSIQKMLDLWSSGMINEQTYVWRKGMINWEPLNQVPDLLSILKRQKKAGSQ